MAGGTAVLGGKRTALLDEIGLFGRGGSGAGKFAI